MTDSSVIRGRRVGILGAGLAGLTAALRLAQSGAEVTVFESDEHVGGRSRTDHIDGFHVDVGTQLIGSMYGHFLQLIREIGLGDVLLPAPGRDALWRGGKAHEVTYGSVTSMVASGGLPFTTKMRLGATYVPFLSRHADSLRLLEPGRIAAAGLDSESIADWGHREIDETFVRSLVYPQLGAYYGSDPASTSAGLYHLLAHHGMDVDLFSMEGGIGRVAETLRESVEARGGAVRCGSPVDYIDLDGDPRVGSAGSEERFDAVVSGLPGPILRERMRSAPAALSEWLDGVRYSPALTAAFLLSRPLDARYFGLSFPQGDTRYTAAIGVQQNKPGGLVPAGKGLLLAIATPETAAELVEMESREVVDLLLPEVQRAFPGVARSIERARVYRWRVGSPLFYPGYLTHLGNFDPDKVEAGGRIAIAGDYLYSPSVEGAVVSGSRAAQRIIQRLAAA